MLGAIQTTGLECVVVKLSSGIGLRGAVPALLFVVWPSLLGYRSGMRVMVARSSQRAGKGAVRNQLCGVPGQA